MLVGVAVHGTTSLTVAYLEGLGGLGPPMQIIPDGDLHPLGLLLTHWGLGSRGAVYFSGFLSWGVLPNLGGPGP